MAIDPPLVAEIKKFLSLNIISELLESYSRLSLAIKLFCELTMNTLKEIQTSFSQMVIFDHGLMDELVAELKSGIENFNSTTPFEDIDKYLTNLYKKSEEFLKSSHKSKIFYFSFFIYYIYLEFEDEWSRFYFKAKFEGIEEKIEFSIDSSGYCVNNYFSRISHDLSKFKMILKLSDRLLQLFPDKNMKITRRIENENVKYFLNVYNRDICEISENSPKNMYEICFEPIGNKFLQISVFNQLL